MHLDDKKLLIKNQEGVMPIKVRLLVGTGDG